MNFISFLLEGPNEKVLRAHYPDDIVSTNIGQTSSPTSSFTYQGKIKTITEDDDKLYRKIDETVSVITISSAIRDNAIGHLKTYKYLAYGTCFIAGASTIGAGTAWGLGYLSGKTALVGGSCLGGVSLLAGFRGSQAEEQQDLWKDPIYDLAKQRVNFSSDLRSIEENDLKGVLFTKEEVKNVFLIQ